MKMQIEIDLDAKRPERWYAEQLSTIGGTGASVVMRKNRFKSPRELWRAMRSVIIDGNLPQQTEPTPDMTRGAILEPVALALAADRLGVPLQHHDQSQFIYHPSMPWAHSLPDAWGGDLPIELKVPRQQTIAKCNMSGLIPEWKLQAQHTMAVTQRRFCFVMLFDAITCAVHPFKEEYDPAAVEALMAAEAAFFATLRDGPEPGELVPEEIDDWAGAVQVLDSDDAKRYGASLRDLKEIKKECDASIEEAKEKLRELSGNAVAYDIPGVIRIRDIPTKGRRTFDTKALQAKYPEVAADTSMWKTGEPGRQFRTFPI